MQPINWQQFGLRKDPYDTIPLIEGGDLPIEHAFVGREQEREFLNALFESNQRLCLTILGDVGVGKTSLTNFHKFIWKYNKPKLLFSFRREIEANEEMLNKNNFLIEIIGSILREIKLMDKNLLKNELLEKANQIVNITQTAAISAGASAFGVGANFGTDKTSSQPIKLSTASLEEYLSALINFIRQNEIAGRKYSGLIVHVNNFDVVLTDTTKKKKTIQFFNEIRDILHTPDVYFLFIGPKNLFKDIISSQKRVKSIFYQSPLTLSPLSKKEIIKAFKERMSLLKSDGVIEYINPVENEVIFRLYDLYEGDIRSIMSGIQDILGQHTDKLTQPLSLDNAMLLLGQQRWNRIEESIKLTNERKTVLRFFIEQNKYISQKEIANLLGKALPNVSGYYFGPLKDAGIIEEKEKIDKTSYWGLTADYIPLKWLIEAQKEILKTIKKQVNQPSLF